MFFYCKKKKVCSIITVNNKNCQFEIVLSFYFKLKRCSINEMLYKLRIKKTNKQTKKTRVNLLELYETCDRSGEQQQPGGNGLPQIKLI